jgi:hypothetical protein
MVTPTHIARWISVGVVLFVWSCGSPANTDVVDGRAPSLDAGLSLDARTDLPEGEGTSAAKDGETSDGTCGRRIYTSPGCGADAAPACEAIGIDASVPLDAGGFTGKLLCGCDGRTFQGNGTSEGRLVYSDRPYRFEGCCPEDPPAVFTNQCVNLLDAGGQ